MALDKDDAKHLEEYLRERNHLKNRLQSMDHLIAELEFKKGKSVDSKANQGELSAGFPEFYKGRSNKIPTDAEVMNED